jgi:hypothetical protein
VNSVADPRPQVHPDPLSDPEYQRWLSDLDAGHYRDEPPTDESPDFDPDRPRDLWPGDEDLAFWTRRTAFDDACEASYDRIPAAELAAITERIAESGRLAAAYAYFFSDFAPAPTDADCTLDYSAELAEETASLERQMAESWAMDQLEAGLTAYDIRDGYEVCRSLGGHVAGRDGEL